MLAATVCFVRLGSYKELSIARRLQGPILMTVQYPPSMSNIITQPPSRPFPLLPSTASVVRSISIQGTEDSVMDSALPTCFDGAVEGSNPQHGRTDKDEASLTEQAIVTVLPHDGDDRNAALTGTVDGRTIPDEEYCETEGVSRSVGDKTDDLSKIALDKTKRARTFHVIGLAFEVLATILAFKQSVSAGALEIANCSFQSRLSEAYISLRAVENCNGPVQASHLLNSTSGTSAFQFGVSFDEHAFEENAFEEHVGCDALTAVSTGDDTFEKRCDCCFFHNGSEYPACSWVPVLGP